MTPLERSDAEDVPYPILGSLALLCAVAALAVASFALHRTYATVREFREARDSAILRAVIAEEQHWLGEWREWTRASDEERERFRSSRNLRTSTPRVSPTPATGLRSEASGAARRSP